MDLKALYGQGDHEHLEFEKYIFEIHRNIICIIKG